MGADPSCRNWVVILKIAEHIAVSHRNDADYEWQRYKLHVLDNLGLSEIDYDELKADMIDILNAGDT